MADQRKGNKVELSTFILWGKQNVTGCKTQTENSKTYVTFIWFSVVHETKMQFYHISREICKSQPLHSFKEIMSSQTIK